MYGTSSLADYMDVAWGGIWGHVFLEARNDCWLSALFVQPDLPHSSCTASATMNSMSGNAKLADRAKLDVFDQTGRHIAGAAIHITPTSSTGQPVSVEAFLPDAMLWTPDTPYLYHARLRLLQGDDLRDEITTCFGMRQFTIDGHHILLNGRRLMLRGYGDDHVYPEQMAMPADKQFYLKRLAMAKQFGFNHVRNHSAIMPPEFYEACDEIGMIATAEFPICYDTYLPGTGYVWKAHAPPLTAPEMANETYYREWEAVIKRYRNHPSIFAWVRGNELYESSPQRAIFREIARKHDPTRPFIDSDSVALEVLKPQNDRETLDFYSVPFAEETTPLDNPHKFKLSKPKKPVLSHESGNYITFTRPKLVDAFQHNFKPFWLTAGKAKLEELGLLSESDRWADRSEQLYVLCHKCNTEAMRKCPYISGYQWWLLQDYWTTSNGILDLYFRPKSITPDEIRQFNRDVVLLQEGVERTYRGNGRLDVAISVSNYSPKTLQGHLSWRVAVGDRSIAAKRTPIPTVPQGEAIAIGRITLNLPDVPKPTKLTIRTALTDAEDGSKNEWNSWVYPEAIRPPASSLPIYADEVQRRMMPAWSLKPIPADRILPDSAVYVTGQLGDARLMDVLERGARVVVLGEGNPLLKSRAVTFRPNWWKGTVFNQSNHTGTFVYDHPATRDMAPDGWCDDGWFYLIEGGRKYSFDSLPARPRVVIRALPTLEKVTDEAILFTVRVGKGCLVVSGLNHRQAADRPENQWLLSRLLEYEEPK
jgi:hypothetical protein